MFVLIPVLCLLLMLILWSVRNYYKKAQANEMTLVLCQEYQMVIEYSVIMMLVFMMVLVSLWLLNPLMANLLV
jgi:hypothetical protein